MKLKYVIVNERQPILFGEGLSHNQFCGIGSITSAGFCSFEEINTPADRMDIVTAKMVKVYVWGKSISCGVESDPIDAEIISQTINKS